MLLSSLSRCWWRRCTCGVTQSTASWRAANELQTQSNKSVGRHAACGIACDNIRFYRPPLSIHRARVIFQYCVTYVETYRPYLNNRGIVSACTWSRLDMCIGYAIVNMYTVYTSETSVYHKRLHIVWYNLLLPWQLRSVCLDKLVCVGLGYEMLCHYKHCSDKRGWNKCSIYRYLTSISFEYQFLKFGHGPFHVYWLSLGGGLLILLNYFYCLMLFIARTRLYMLPHAWLSVDRLNRHAVLCRTTHGSIPSKFFYCLLARFSHN